MKLLAAREPLLYSFQTALPKLPVPPVEATIARVRGAAAGGSIRGGWGRRGHPEPPSRSTWSRCAR